MKPENLAILRRYTRNGADAVARGSRFMMTPEFVEQLIEDARAEERAKLTPSPLEVETAPAPDLVPLLCNGVRIGHVSAQQAAALFSMPIAWSLGFERGHVPEEPEA